LQLTAFGARDRAFFEVILESAPRRQLKRNTLGRWHHSLPMTELSFFTSDTAIGNFRLGRGNLL